MQPIIESKPLTSFNDVFSNVQSYLPNLLAGIIVVLLGFVVAWIGGRLLVRLLLFSRIDRVIVRLGWTRALASGDVRHSLFEFAGLVFSVIVFLVFLDNAILIWQLTVLSSLLERFVDMIPRLLAAGISLLVGWGVALGVSRAVRRALYQEEFERARLVARIVFAAIVVVASAIALVQLEIAVSIVTGAFLIAFGALALSFVLAFGLGSKRAVELMWEERLRQGQDDPPKETSKPDSRQS